MCVTRVGRLIMYVTLSAQTTHSSYFVETEIITPSENTFTADHKATSFFNGFDLRKQCFRCLNIIDMKVYFDRMQYFKCGLIPNA